MMKTNVQGTENIVNLCLSKGVEKLCHVSSVAAIGFSEDGSSVNETKVWKDGLKTVIAYQANTKQNWKYGGAWKRVCLLSL